ncbi:hypothetical protein AB4Z50_34985 [Paenibacillus sp. 2TAB26]|uniref:hypothetical protein n=1 Tax=Paenibacillus sp. 2TAB26 TaxID=3233005 RepID=UPI003F98E250
MVHILGSYRDIVYVRKLINNFYNDIDNQRMNKDERYVDRVHKSFLVLVQYTQRGNKSIDKGVIANLIAVEKDYNLFLLKIGEPSNYSLTKPDMKKKRGLYKILLTKRKLLRELSLVV